MEAVASGLKVIKSPFRSGKCVHFLFNDVCLLADASGKKLGAFHDGDPDILETEILKQGRGLFFNELPEFDFSGKDVFESAN